jgi:hypothetical protein
MSFAVCVKNLASATGACGRTKLAPAGGAVAKSRSS